MKAEGFSVWLDQLDIPAGTRWDVELEKALEECEIFMIIMTPASIGSENVRDEIGYAIDNGKRFLPVLLENCNVPLRLRRFQYVDFTNKTFDDGVESAKDLLRNLIAQTTIPRREVPADTEGESAQAEADRLAAQKAESDRVAKQKADDEQFAKARAETERKAKEEADRLAAQKAESDRVAKQKAEAELAAKAKADKERKDKEEADRLAKQKIEDERLAKQKADAELAAKAKADKERKDKEEADRIAAQKAEADRKAKKEAEEKSAPVEPKATPVAVAPASKKPASKGLMYGIGAVVLLVLIGIVFSVISNGGNKNLPVSTPTSQVIVETLQATVTQALPTATPAAVGETVTDGKIKVTVLYMYRRDFVRTNNSTTWSSSDNVMDFLVKIENLQGGSVSIQWEDVMLIEGLSQKKQKAQCANWKVANSGESIDVVAIFDSTCSEAYNVNALAFNDVVYLRLTYFVGRDQDFVLFRIGDTPLIKVYK